MRFAAIISALILSAVSGVYAHARPALTPAEMTVCKNVKHCIDIIDRHGPESFDYQVLNEEFQRFGTQGKAALISMLGHKDETDIRRAQAVLARDRVLLSPDEQRKIAALWPRGDVQTHAKIMQNALSPLMRARLIDTLSDKNPEVRKLSRDLLARTTQMKMNFPLQPGHFAKLARALLDDPTPALVELIATFDAEKTRPVFTRLLQSTDGPTLFKAYEELHAENPESAFKALVATLYNLKDTQTDAAFALSYVLQARHKSRADGFYLKFAKDLTEDSEMSLMGRVAGFDAVMQSEAAPKLSAPSQYYKVITTALKNHDNLPAGYLQTMPRQAEGHSNMWLTAYWEHFRPLEGEQKLDFIRLVGGFDTPLAKTILREALDDKSDWRIIQSAALPLGRLKDEEAARKLEDLADHPVMAVQIAALTAIDGIKTGSTKGRPAFWKKRLTMQSGYCTATPKDFKEDTKGLPFFDLNDLDFIAGGDKRRFVSTIAPTRSGYLVGFDAGSRGGDLRYYDNASGDSTGLKHHLANGPENITAIIPVTPPPLGQYANAFWVIAHNDGRADQAKLYRLTSSAGRFKVRYQAELPHRVTALAPQKNGDVFMSFYKEGEQLQQVNPPLLLSPNGAIRRACTASADSAEALP